MPQPSIQEKHTTVHHTLGNGEFDQFMTMAEPNRRVVLITGEGSHQMNAQEISQFYRYGLKPIIFVLNNHGYLIERMLSKKLDYCYNELAEWQYDKLPEVLGCNDWITRKATICGNNSPEDMNICIGASKRYAEHRPGNFSDDRFDITP